MVFGRVLDARAPRRGDGAAIRARVEGLLAGAVAREAPDRRHGHDAALAALGLLFGPRLHAVLVVDADALVVEGLELNTGVAQRRVLRVVAHLVVAELVLAF